MQPQSPSYGLALHTSSPDLGLAISNFAGDDRHQVWSLGRDTSNLLHSYLVEFLQPQTWKDLMFVAVANGPGGFTGTRIGVVAARTLAQQLEIPLFAISTLAAVAWNEGRTLGKPIEIAVQMPAQRGQMFGAIYRIDSPYLPDQREQSHLPPCQGGQGGISMNLAPPRLITRLPDAVMALDTWQQTLE
ncbi:MAG: tRNA (adenosine(37)-N6)-threonylcarbamoyltransferase complex dimerization subunit type 1 TsaB, partial [Leptolyngbyaceae cyanobacterium RU_5_1]|nr:tRNA (adenosine(37)-N6)-threonylcarbamoyltransferase complex dimerization subunit type 1 TsaB [Leptolyngbyaceae cyanobacterium RU_5_1]